MTFAPPSRTALPRDTSALSPSSPPRRRQGHTSDAPDALRPRNLRAFSLAEVLVVIALIIILLALLLSHLGGMRTSTHIAECASNQHQIGVAIKAFTAERKRVPNAAEVIGDLGQYMHQQVGRMFYCPSVARRGDVSYGVNPCVTKLHGDGGKIVLLDAHEQLAFYEGENSDKWLSRAAPRHTAEVMNVLYYDGHVEQHVPPKVNPYASVEILDQLWRPTRPCDASGGGGADAGCGVYATYYTGNWAGESADRLDGTLHVPFGSPPFWGVDWNIPLPGSNTTGWDTGSFGSATWTGKIKADTTGEHTFHVACDNEAWLMVNGQQLLHRLAGNSGGCPTCVDTYEASTPIHLTAGEWVSIEVRLKELTPGVSPSHVSVKWQVGTGAQSAIPCLNLRP